MRIKSVIMKVLPCLAMAILAIGAVSYGMSTVYGQNPCPNPDEVMVKGVCEPAIDDDGSNEAIGLDTDRSTYADGNTVVVNGTINTSEDDYGGYLTITIRSADGNIVGIAQLAPKSDGSFMKTFVAGGPLWQKSGTYTVQANYGIDTTSTTFEFGGSAGVVAPPSTPPPLVCADDEMIKDGECVAKPAEKPAEPTPPPVVTPPPPVVEPKPAPPPPPPPEPPQCGPGTEPDANGICQVVEKPEPKPATPADDRSGGCLIATAVYGSELAPQVQLLREVRDGTLYSTASGASFMAGFNQMYYYFSPTVADWERQNPAFKEVVRAAITPMLSSLSIMTLADQGSETEVLGYGISVIILNLGMYIAAPVGAVFAARRCLKFRA